LIVSSKPKRRTLNGEGLFELKERKRLAMSTQMRRGGGGVI